MPSFTFSCRQRLKYFRNVWRQIWWCTVFPEWPMAIQFVKTFPVFYGTRSLITMSIRIYFCTLFLASLIQTAVSHIISLRAIWDYSLTTRYHLRFSTEILYAFLISSMHVIIPHISSSYVDLAILFIWWRVQIMTLFISFLHSPFSSSLLYPTISRCTYNFCVK
jgi:hypothetical protein